MQHLLSNLCHEFKCISEQNNLETIKLLSLWHKIEELHKACGLVNKNDTGSVLGYSSMKIAKNQLAFANKTAHIATMRKLQMAGLFCCSSF